ncbi:MAG TPA: SDR family oxidoreductase [Lacunisphaera sp.]|nr:SDR family oxidoreductase [Lacunisphaera sp.]
MKTENQGTALITGASSGIGLHLAHVFAKNGHNLVLVAPIPSEIEEVANQIQTQFGVSVRALPVDLATLDEDPTVFADVADDVRILCNNAGLGRRGRFEEVSLDDHLQILRVNVEAVLRLTAFFLPRFIERGSGRILNTASIAGFEPGPLMASYHASKAYVLSLTESLATENAETGVTFTALCPGPVDTDFFEKAGMPEAVAFQKGNLMAPQDVAEAAYEALMAGKRTVVPGAINKANIASSRVTSKAAQAKMSQKQYEDADEHKRDRGDKEIPAMARHHH